MKKNWLAAPNTLLPLLDGNITFPIIFSLSLSLLLVFPASPCAGQTGNWEVRHFTSENGLPQNSIKGIERDRLGYLWLATEMGLARYDGTRFRLYNKTNNPVIPSTRMTKMESKPDGTILVVPESGHLLKIDDKGTLRRASDSLGPNPIADIYDVYESCKEVASTDPSLKWVIPDAHSINRSALTSLVSIKDRYYYFNARGQLIAADTALKNFKIVRLTSLFPLADKDSLFGNIEVDLLPDGDQCFLRWGPWLYRLHFAPGIESADAERVLWIGSIPFVNACRYWKREGIFWIGTLSEGLFEYRRQMFSTLVFKNAESDIFYAQEPIGSNGSFTSKGALFPDQVIPLQELNPQSVLRDAKGHFYGNRWQDSAQSSIIEWDSKLHEVREISEPNLHVSCFRQFADGSIWVTSKNGLLGKLVGNSFRWVPLPSNLSPTIRITTFLEGDNGTVWLGTANGLAHYQFSDSSLQFLPGLRTLDVRCIYRDLNGTFWIGTYGNGFYALYKDSVIKLPLDQDNYLATVHGFIEDNHGYCWMTTNKGLFKASMQDLYAYLQGRIQRVYYYYFDRADGFLTNEFNGGCNPSVIQLADGKFSFPTMHGLVQFNPDSVQTLMADFPIDIDEMALDTQLIQDQASLPQISPEIGRIRFDVSSPYFGNAYNQQIEYRLVGLDSNWYSVGEDRTISFNKLPPGNYMLELRKIGGFGKDNFVRKQVAFVIEPPFQRTLFFQVLISLAILALALLIFRFRVNYLLRQKRKLEKEVAERTKEQQFLIEHLEESIKEVERSKEELYKNSLLKDNLAMIVTHDLRSPLRFLHDAAFRLKDEMSKKAKEELLPQAAELEKSSRSIALFVDDFSWWLTTMGKNFRINPNRISALELSASLEDFFREQLLARRNSLTTRVESLDIWTDRELLTLILRNIIDNANKYSSEGEIKLEIFSFAGSCTIRITDNGKGMSPETLASLHKRMLSSSDGSLGRNDRFGYRFIIDFCNLLDLKLSVDSVQGAGTVVTLNGIPTNAPSL